MTLLRVSSGSNAGHSAGSLFLANMNDFYDRLRHASVCLEAPIAEAMLDGAVGCAFEAAVAMQI